MVYCLRNCCVYFNLVEITSNIIGLQYLDRISTNIIYYLSREIPTAKVDMYVKTKCALRHPIRATPTHVDLELNVHQNPIHLEASPVNVQEDSSETLM